MLLEGRVLTCVIRSVDPFALWGTAYVVERTIRVGLTRKMSFCWTFGGASLLVTTDLSLIRSCPHMLSHNPDLYSRHCNPNILSGCGILPISP